MTESTTSAPVARLKTTNRSGAAVFEQNKGQTRQLGPVLDQLAVRFKVSVAYRDDVVNDKRVNLSNQRFSSIEQALDKLLEPAGLAYEKAGPGFYIIIQKKQANNKTSVIDSIPASFPSSGQRTEGRSSSRQLDADASLSLQRWQQQLERYYLSAKSIVKGRVTDQQNSPLPGVSVLIRGTTNGTVTDANGAYQLNVEEAEAVLVFSFIGYITEQVAVSGRAQVDVMLVPSIANLNEVVVIGYGQREKRDLTGAVSQISAKEITQQVNMTPELAMQGRMPGIFVSNPGSSPTARPEIRIRGVGTLGFNDPLYVLDGIPLTEGGNFGSARTADLRGNVNIFALINPNDIESISVLKDASATAIYGVRAANGVILITTKRGKKDGRLRVDLSARTGVQNIGKRYDVLSTQQYVDITREAWANRPGFVPDGAVAPLFDPASADYLGNSPQYTADWEKAAVRRNAPVQDYSISVSGGSQASNYFVGLGYSDQQNVVYSDRFKRYSLSVNSDHKISKWFNAGQTLRLVYGQNDQDGGVGSLGSFAAPWQPLYDASDPTGYARTRRTINNTSRAQGYGAGTGNNFVAIGDLNHNQRDLFRTTASLYGEITPLKGLRLRGTYSIDYLGNTRQVYEDQRMGFFVAAEGNARTAAGNAYNRRLSENLNRVGEFLIGYTTSIGRHNVDLVLNAMDQKVSWNNTQMQIGVSSPVPSWEQRRIEEGWPNANKSTFYERIPSGLQGYMARLSYNYNRKYYLDATVRRDGTSKFGPGYKWGTFPSFAGAWRVKSEAFLEKAEWLSELKIRGGWGRIGNQEVRDFAFLSLINVNPKAAFGTDGTLGAGNGRIYDAAGLSTLPTPDLSWEVVTTSNIGIETEFLQGKFRFNAEYYSRFTDGILQSYPIPRSMGIVIDPVVNLAQVSNRGFEFEGGYNQRWGKLAVNLGFNLTTVRNRVERLYNDIPVGGDQDRIQVGHPINSFFGYRSEGIFQTTQEVDTWKGQTTDRVGNPTFLSPGDVHFVDFAGAPAAGSPGSVFQSLGADGVINASDRTILGKSIPGYYYGINLGATYQHFDLSILFRGTGDVQRVSRNGRESIGGGGGNYLADYLNRWTAERPSSTIPRAVQGDPTLNNRFSDRFVRDAGFLRLQTVQLGYVFATGLVERFGMSNLRLTASASNLFVLSSFPDLDPENITTPTSFVLGLNLGF
jgi:TonB-linked SusC/RagA family outer membrane protein